MCQGGLMPLVLARELKKCSLDFELKNMVVILMVIDDAPTLSRLNFRFFLFD